MKKVALLLLPLLVGGASAQEVALTSALVEENYSIVHAGTDWETVRAVNARLEQVDGAKISVEIVDRTDSVLPMIATGGHVYLTTLMLNTISPFPDEVAAVIAALRVLARQRYGETRQGFNLGQALIGLIKDETVRDVAGTLAGLGSSSASRAQVGQAHLTGLETLSKAGFQPTAMYSLQTRLQTLAGQDEGDSTFAEYFSYYPSTSSVLENVLRKIVVDQYGRDIRQALVPRAKAASGDVLAEYANTDPNMPAAYQASTGYELRSVSYWPRGQCTWLAAMTRPDEIPRGPAGTNNAHTWWDRLIAAGYSHFSDPKIGTMPIWDQKVGGGAGHVAVVTETYADGSFAVWDCNWGPEAADTDQLNGRVRHRIVRSRKNILGFIGWPNGQTMAPAGYLGYVEPGRSSIELVRDPFHLGDDLPQAVMLRQFDFNLTEADLAGKKQAVLHAWIKAVPQKDPVFTVNTTEYGRVVAEQEEWTEYEFAQPISTLHVGANLLIVRTITPSFGSGYDACDVKHISLSLQ